MVPLLRLGKVDPGHPRATFGQLLAAAIAKPTKTRLPPTETIHGPMREAQANLIRKLRERDLRP